MITELSIRDLYHEIPKYKGNKILSELLKPWLKQNGYREYLQTLLISEQMTDSDNWELYALSRVLDVLTLTSKPDRYTEAFNGEGSLLTTNEYIEWIQFLGLDIVYPGQYDPFHCEIATAIAGAVNFHIFDCLQPAIKLKNLMIKRSPVVISLNPKDYDLDQVNNAMLYWTFRRSNKNTADLSEGWGSNSQWRTAFRLDIETEHSYIYNLKNTLDLHEPDEAVIAELKAQDLTIEEAIELLVYRQFTLCTKEDKDKFPYDFGYETPKH